MDDDFRPILVQGFHDDVYGRSLNGLYDIEMEELEAGNPMHYYVKSVVKDRIFEHWPSKRRWQLKRFERKGEDVDAAYLTCDELAPIHQAAKKGK
jgi:hypothetical protein